MANNLKYMFSYLYIIHQCSEVQPLCFRMIIMIRFLRDMSISPNVMMTAKNFILVMTGNQKILKVFAYSCFKVQKPIEEDQLGCCRDAEKQKNTLTQTMQEQEYKSVNQDKSAFGSLQKFGMLQSRIKLELLQCAYLLSSLSSPHRLTSVTPRSC